MAGHAFQSPFTFPSGKSCRDFDELGLACQDNWAETLELLQQGYLENFLGNLGRADLALAAREAARFPDRDRGLDQLLARMPGNAIEPPRLEVEPTEVNLGQMKPGEDRELELHLANKGMRLLYGSVTCDNCVWLGLGDAPGATEKLFQFTHDLDLSLHVRGKLLQASRKPHEGRLLIESNGGTATVIVRADVPVKPFPDGLLAGAQSPREVADLAKEHLRSHLKETAALFENGAVAQWYRDNGWTYPVHGPVAEGAAAVQQFFDALGLSRPPRVEISDETVTLRGHVGVPLEYVVEVTAHERRPIYAHGTSDQPWLEVGRARLDPRSAGLTIPLVVPAVPDREGETLRANVTIVANGKQRLTVPVTLEVGGNLNFGPVPPGLGAVDIITAPEPPKPVLAKPQPEPVLSHSKVPVLGKQWLHAIPAVALGLALFVVVLLDLRGPLKSSALNAESGESAWILEDPEPRIGVSFNKRRRFGIQMLKERDPTEPEKNKRLTLGEDGWSNNTCIRLDGHENLFGQEPGEWARDPETRRSLKVIEWKVKNRHRWTSTWNYSQEKVLVRQTVEIVPNMQTHVLDTCLVHYRIDNHDTVSHKVGLRVMIDTFIGANDGVPFVIPGQPGLLETKKVFGQKEIPDYIEALERPNLTDPGTIAHMGLKLAPDIKIQRDDPELDALVRLVVCRWPDNKDKRWKWDYEAMNAVPEKKDSCVVLYWDEELMEPGANRSMAFTYGLGRMSSSGAGSLGLTVGGSFQPGKVFTVTAYVKEPKEGQKVKLILPGSLTLAPRDGDEEQMEEKVVEQSKDYSQVSWRVKANQEGTFTLEVASGRDLERVRIQIKKAGLFD
jgi:hypothetical protein